MESNINHPLAFFEAFLTKDNIKHQLQSFYNDAIENERVEDIDYDTKEVIIQGQDENGNFALQKIVFADILKRKLEAQYLISKHFIDDASVMYQNSKEEFNNYLSRQENTIRYINLILEPLLIQYPYLLTPIRDIYEYISKRYSFKGSLITNNTESITPEELVVSIFGFMKGVNEARQQIMSEDEYNLMIGYIVAFIKEDKAPYIEKKLHKTNINNELLRFLFWVLHYESYGTLKIKDNFFEFMIASFKQFENVSHKTLRSKFANKTNLSAKSYLPEKVNSYLGK